MRQMGFLNIKCVLFFRLGTFFIFPFNKSHTGENVVPWVEMECDKWAITEDVGVVTTDTAANMIKMAQYLPMNFFHCGCLNHILQLVIKDELFLETIHQVSHEDMQTDMHFC